MPSAVGILRELIPKASKNHWAPWVLRLGMPQKLSMQNKKTNRSTDLLYKDYKFGVGLDDKDFVKGKLKRLR